MVVSRCVIEVEQRDVELARPRAASTRQGRRRVRVAAISLRQEPEGLEDIPWSSASALWLDRAYRVLVVEGVPGYHQKLIRQ